ncbi:hypothetical protein BVG16_06800 [Paenibacillus selenitireducens]|uniref:Uncharacterized protein n=1 Tax=Paenibacillus selenitireducens TaxID=1324314 RepID=A0A1T2XL93_9BACL|nr:hypothetical protein [Paenibacillus selenitireducens]OPA80433.1 hypothetical protein BVG16_06800 [Paenibacillus selenitireducens]
MNKEDKKDTPLRLQLFDQEGKPLRVLSTSLGIALLANVFLLPSDVNMASAEPNTSQSTTEPVLVEWSNDDVKKYFDAAVDWNIPSLVSDKQGTEEEGDQGGAGGSSGGSSGGGTTVVHTTSGFGWNDLLLYHLIFNRGSTYSSNSWYSNHTAYDTRSGNVYKPQKYGASTFQNRTVHGSSVVPKTSKSSGSITKRSTSSSPGGIGGKSSGFSSSGSSSGSKSGGSFGGFGG